MKTRFGIPFFLLIASCSSDPTVMSDDFVAGQCYDLTGDPTTVGMHYLEFADGGAPFTEGFYYGGAEKTYKVHANIPWKVSTNRREAVITIVDNETFKVKLPKSIACAPRTLTVTLSPSTEISEVSPKTFSTVWGSPVWSGGDGWNLDSETGSATLTINNAVGRLFSIDKYKYGYFEWTFSNVNISQGDLSIVGGKINTNNEPYLTFSYGNKNAYTAYGMVDNPTKIYFGNDNGWLPLYTAIFQAGYPTINNLKKIRLMITPYDGKGGNYAKGIRRRIWINDVLVIDDWNGGDIWQGTHDGLPYDFGIDSGTGMITCNTFVADPNYWNYSIPSETENEIIFYDDFDQADGLDYDSWSHVPYGTAAWQIYMSGSPDQAYVKDGKLILTIEKKDGKVVSGGIKTQGKKWFNNCRIEVCARFVEDAGSIGQAIWLMPEPMYQIYPGWPHGGEIDIMEHSYLNDYVQQTLHSHYIDIYQETPSGKAAYAGYNKGTFNVYSADLTDEEIVFYTNDKETMRYANQHFPNESELMQWPFRGQYYLILSIGAAGRSEVQDTDIPSFMEVDWVRVTRLGN